MEELKKKIKRNKHEAWKYFDAFVSERDVEDINIAICYLQENIQLVDDFKCRHSLNEDPDLGYEFIRGNVLGHIEMFTNTRNYHANGYTSHGMKLDQVIEEELDAEIYDEFLESGEFY